MIAASALALLISEMFTNEKGDRDYVPNFGIIITDGKPGDSDGTKAAAQAARDAGTTLLSVGVGDGIDFTELVDIANSPPSKYVFTVANYSQLAEIQSEFLRQTCTGLFVCLCGLILSFRVTDCAVIACLSS